MLGGEIVLKRMSMKGTVQGNKEWGFLSNWGIGLGDWGDIKESPWRLNSRVFIQSGPGGELQICFPG